MDNPSVSSRNAAEAAILSVLLEWWDDLQFMSRDALAERITDALADAGLIYGGDLRTESLLAEKSKRRAIARANGWDSDWRAFDIYVSLGIEPVQLRG